MPLQSIILTPTKNTLLDVDGDSNENTGHHVIKVRGIAYSGGENTQIEKIEVTVDDGRSWQVASILQHDEEYGNLTKTSSKSDAKVSTNHAWIQFEADVTIPVPASKNKKLYIYSRATDSNGLTQPRQSAKQRGYVYNGWGKTSLILRE